jgi:hypothetical protein
MRIKITRKGLSKYYESNNFTDCKKVWNTYLSAGYGVEVC